MRSFKAVLLTFIILFSAAAAFAGGKEPTTEELMKEISALKVRVTQLEAKLAEQCEVTDKQGEQIKKHEDHIFHKTGVKELFTKEGLSIGAGATFIAQGTPNANGAGGGEDSRFDGCYKVDIEIEKEFGDFGLGYILLEAGQGDTIESDLSVFSNVNQAAAGTNAHVDAIEVWYEHYLFDNQITVTGGKIDTTNYIDKNEYANDETAQFIGRMFRNSPVIDFPDDNGPGVRLRIAPKEIDFLEIDGTWADEDADWENLVDKTFVAAQVNFMPAKAFDYDEDKWGGNYRAIFWYNGGDHTKLEDTSETKEDNHGFGISCDQKVTETFGLFGRFGWQDPSVSDIEYHWSAGIQMMGEYWNREDDFVAVAFGQAIPGKDYGDAGNPHDNENHLEAYYSYKVNEYLTISPDFQIIWNPNGVGNKNDGDNDTIFVYGARGQVGF